MNISKFILLSGKKNWKSLWWETVLNNKLWSHLDPLLLFLLWFYSSIRSLCFLILRHHFCSKGQERILRTHKHTDTDTLTARLGLVTRNVAELHLASYTSFILPLSCCRIRFLRIGFLSFVPFSPLTHFPSTPWCPCNFTKCHSKGPHSVLCPWPYVLATFLLFATSSLLSCLSSLK